MFQASIEDAVVVVEATEEATEVVAATHHIIGREEGVCLPTLITNV